MEKQKTQDQRIQDSTSQDKTKYGQQKEREEEIDETDEKQGKWNENIQYSTCEHIQETDQMTGKKTGIEYDIYKSFQKNGRIKEWKIETNPPDSPPQETTKENTVPA